MTKPKKKPPRRDNGKHPGGRPTDYREEYPEQARKYCLLGATNEELAKFFEVATSTIELWMTKYPKFSGAVKEGREVADAEIAQSLYHRAKGYSHPEDKILQANGLPLIVPTTKHYPPDTAAAIIWLKNRQRTKWRDKIDHEHGGPDGGAIHIHLSNDDSKLL